MTSSLLLSLFCFFSMTDAQLANTCTYTTRVTVTKTRTKYERCERSEPLSDRCGQLVYYNTTKLTTFTRCCSGWRGRDCNIPVCTNPKCQNNAFCSGKNNCFCRKDSFRRYTCTVAKCSSSYRYGTSNDCFPGTCSAASSRYCQCSSGFTGTNCLKMRDSPTFTKCQFSLLATSGENEQVVFMGQCNSKEKLYSNARYINLVTVDWETKYQLSEDMPSRPTYVRSYQFGIASADVQGSLIYHNGRTTGRISMTCSSRLITASPVAVLRCSNSSYLGATTIRHGYSLQATVTATSGGYKDVSGSYSRTQFNGKTASLTASMTFDLVSPTHCADQRHCVDGWGPAVDVGPEFDRTVIPTRQLRWFGWTDADSGLRTFSYKVYPLEPDTTGLLTEKAQPIVTGSQTAFTTTYPTFSLPGPGMYSAVLEVTDGAGNVAAARGLLLWDSDSKVTLTDSPMSVQGKGTSNSIGRFVAKWQAHFENAFHHDNKLLNGVKPWRTDVDDTEGNLTVDAIPNIHGIVQFVFGYSGVSRRAPITWVNVGLSQQYELWKTLPFRIYVKAYDVTGNSATDSLLVEQSKGLGAGAIVGIVIGVIWAVVFVATLCILAVFALTRYRRNEPYMPHNFADFRQTLRQSVQFDNSATTNPSEFQLSVNRQQPPPFREAADGDDIEVYGYMETDDVADWKISAKKMVLGKRLPNSAGRFADIFEATVKLTDIRQSVVAKKLKHGGNDESKLLMTAKMNFWATACPRHENILHFVAAITNGPILLFEKCDLGRLRDWLAAQTQQTDELQDNMITFSLQIARGMRHLHAHKIIHRRLGARNILLKSDGVGSIVAKIAGFGPMKGEIQSANKAEGRIPVKWMAPEQFNLVAGAKRNYNMKTDIWSFGVTLWEIFSKGETPYSDCGSGELNALLSTGYRMPRPTHCPDMMYDEVVTPCWDCNAISRPSFIDVVTVVETVFLNGGGGEGYYYERSQAPPEPSNDNNTYEAAPNHSYDNNTYEATPESGNDTYEPTL